MGWREEEKVVVLSEAAVDSSKISLNFKLVTECRDRCIQSFMGSPRT